MVDTSVRRVLVYRLGSLGDTLIALPALHLIRRAFPRAERRLLTNVPVHAKAPAAAAVLDGSGLIDGYLQYSAGTRNALGLARLWWQVVRYRPEVVVYLAAGRGVATARRDLRFFRLCGVRRVLGVPLTGAMQSNFYGAAPESEEAAQMLSEAALEAEAARLVRNLPELGEARLEVESNWSMHLTPAEHERAGELTREADGWTERPFAVSVGTKVQAKDWGRENWRALLTRLANEAPGRPLFLLGATEESEASAFAAAGWVAHGGGPVVNLCGRLSPRQSAAAIQRAELFLGHDSGPMHLAAAVGTASVAIFAARNVPRQWFPFGDRHRVVYHRVDCWGCGLETCVEQRKRCLTGIAVDQVLTAVRLSLNRDSVAGCRALGSSTGLPARDLVSIEAVAQQIGR